MYFTVFIEEEKYKVRSYVVFLRTSSTPIVSLDKGIL